MNLDAIRSATQLHSALTEKQAQPGAPIPHYQSRRDMLRSDALGNFANILMAGGGVGLGARGLYGLLQLLGRQGEKEEDVPGEVTTPLAIKASNEIVPDPTFSKERGLWSAAKMPMGLAGGAAGLYGGWKLLDYILDKRRKAEADSDLAKAKKEYEAAVAEGIKYSEDGGELSVELDRMFDLCEKQSAEAFAELEKQGLDLSEGLGSLAGAYGMYAVPSTLLAGILSYPMFAKGKRKKLLEKAKKKREIERSQIHPKPIYLDPQVLRTSLSKRKKKEDKTAPDPVGQSPALEFEDSLDRI